MNVGKIWFATFETYTRSAIGEETSSSSEKGEMRAKVISQRSLGRAFSDSAIFSAPPKRQSPRERAQFLASFSLSVKRPWQKTRQESEDKKCELKSRYSRAAQWPVRPLVRPFLLGEGRAGPSKKQFGRCRLLLIGWKMLKNHERYGGDASHQIKGAILDRENGLRNRRFHLRRA